MQDKVITMGLIKYFAINKTINKKCIIYILLIMSIVNVQYTISINANKTKKISITIIKKG